MNQDVLGHALLDYQNGDYTEDIKTYSSLDEEDTLPLPYLFRTFDEMPTLEQKALELCRGSVLDIGCGAGSHGLFLQEKKVEVTCLDHSKGAIEVCKQRGIINYIQSSILDYNEDTFDTLLLLMNGVGIAGELIQIGDFLNKLKSLLKPDGQIILDSSDIIYMFEGDDDGGHWIPDNNYYGEVTFTMEYKKLKSEPFNWLYVDFNTLKRAANYHKLNCELVMEGEHYDYLARLTHL